MYFTRGQVARGIEAVLVEIRDRVQRTMPADLLATPGYLAMNQGRWGIPAEVAEAAAWRAREGHRFDLEPGFVVLGVAPPPAPGGRPMLLLTYDARDGAGTKLLAAWWVPWDAPRDPAAAFGRHVARFGVHLSDGRHESLFYLHSPRSVPPQPTRRARDVELHAIRQSRQFVGATGWAWCFGIDTRRYQAYLDASDRTAAPPDAGGSER